MTISAAALLPRITRDIAMITRTGRQRCAGGLGVRGGISASMGRGGGTDGHGERREAGAEAVAIGHIIAGRF